jgi:hypothetical protein
VPPVGADELLAPPALLVPLDPQAAAVIAMAAAPQATASSPRARRRRVDGNSPIVRSSLLFVVSTRRGPAIVSGARSPEWEP